METEYDEDINENEWYQTLCNKYDELFSRVTTERWMICVPRLGTWKSYALEDDLFSQKYFESHILKEVVIYNPNEDSENDGNKDSDKTSKYITYNGKEVLISGSKIQCSKGFHNRAQKPEYNRQEGQLQLNMEAFHSSQILFEETFFNQNDESFVVVCISQPLEANLVLNVSTDKENSKDSSIKQQEDNHRHHGNGDDGLIWKKSSGGRVKSLVGDLICQFNNQVYKSAPSTMSDRCEVDDKKLEDIISLFSIKIKNLLRSCLHVAQKDVKTKKLLESKYDGERFQNSLEGYCLNCTYESTMKQLNNLLSINESLFNRKTRRLSSIKLYHLGIKESFWSSVPRARRQLSRINKHRTISGKLKCLDLTISHLSSSSTVRSSNAGGSSDVAILSSDDLLPLLIYLVIKCDVNNWIANIAYLKINRSQTSSKFDFYLTTLEAAIQHVKNTNERLDKIEETESLSRSNENQNLQHLFQLIRTGSPDQVDMFLRQNESMKVLQEHDKCHPLCECNKCIKLDERKVQSGHSQVVNATMRDERGWTALHVAASSARHEMIDVLINHKADVTMTDYHGLTALHVAAQEGSQSVIFILMHLGANPSATDNNNNTPLHLAALNGHDGSVKAFLYFDPTSSVVKINARNDGGDTCLHIACRWGFVEIVEVLMECGADVSLVNRVSSTPHQLARDDYVSYVLNNTQISTRYEELRPLPNKPSSSSSKTKSAPTRKKERSTSSKSSNKNNLSSFLSYSSSFNKNKENTTVDIDKEISRLHRAVQDNDINMVARICGWSPPGTTSPSSTPSTSKKCHPLCQCTSCCPPRKSCRHLHANSVATDGQAPLQVAARFGHVEMVRFLLSNGARPEGRRRGIGAHNLTAFHLAAQYGHVKALEVLLTRSLSCGGDIRDGENNTPMFMSARNGHTNCIKLLIEHGASTNSRNKKGDSPLHEAVKWSNVEACKILISKGASVFSKNEQGCTPLDIASKDVEMMEELAQVLRVFNKKHYNISRNENEKASNASTTGSESKTAGDEDEEEKEEREEKKKENIADHDLFANLQVTTEIEEAEIKVNNEERKSETGFMTSHDEPTDEHPTSSGGLDGESYFEISNLEALAYNTQMDDVVGQLEDAMREQPPDEYLSL